MGLRNLAARTWRWSAAVVSSTPRYGEGDTRVMVDGNTRTFWSRGDRSTSTLVEAEVRGAAVPMSGRRARLARAQAAAGAGAVATARGARGNPAFSEALFVELMRAEQFPRAFDLLAPECQRRWRTADAFAQAHRNQGTRRLLGVDVNDVRYLDSWHDPDSGVVHSGVAELDVDYAFAAGDDQAASLRQTVHLVPVNGKWRSLAYPR